MPWRGPSYEGEFPSLGVPLLELAEEYLAVPGGDEYGKPFRFTEEQVRHVVLAYRIDPKTGRRVYRRTSLRRSKGSGKSPFSAACHFVEFTGPVVFDGWDAHGNPVGRPRANPWQQAAAVSEDQTDNTWVQLLDMLRESPALDDFRLDLGLTRIFYKDGPGRIEPVTSSSGSREGQPVTFATLDETHVWSPTNGGRKLAATIRRNIAKTGGWSLETTNAFSPGEGSVAEETFKADAKGAAGLLYDNREAPWVEDLSDREAMLPALKFAYGDAYWVDLERVFEECNDPSTDPSDARRFYLNQIVKAQGRAVDPKLWSAAARRGPLPEAGEYIGLGFDGSLSKDATVLVGCTADGHQFLIRAWERPPNAGRDWRVPRNEVQATVRDAFAHWRVGRMLCDPAQWLSEIENWIAEFGEEVVVVFDTNQPRRMAPACERFVTDLVEGTSTHDGDETLTRHVLNMARKQVRLTDDPEDGRTRYVFVKSGTGKIDAGIAAVLAREAAMTMPEDSPVRFFSLADL